MRRMTLPIFAVSLILTNPALAQEHHPEVDAIDRLNDPVFQDDMVAMMSGFMSAMMDLPIGQFAHVIDRALPEEMRRDDDFSHIDPEATLGDIARHDDPDFDRNAEEKIRHGTAMAGMMAVEFGSLFAEFQAIGDRWKQHLDAQQ